MAEAIESAEGTLHDLFTRIAHLEEEHGLLGVSFMVKDNKSAIPADTVAEFVVDVINTSVELFNDSANIPVTDPRSP